MERVSSMWSDSLRSWYGLNQNRVRAALVVLSVILVIYLLCLILRALFFASPVVFAEVNFQRPAGANVQWNWYAGAAEPEEEVEEEDIADASISAELFGVVIAGEDSIATLTVSRKPAQVYRIGDELDRNVTLEEIEPNRVVISQNGTRRQILLNDITGGAQDSSDKESLIRVNDEPAPARAGFSLPGVGSTTPIRVEGGGTGLRLSGVSEDIGDLADLRENDVVLDINGTPVADLFTNPLLWQQFSQETNLPMTVLRDGNQEEVYVNAASLFERIIPQLDAGLIQ